MATKESIEFDFQKALDQANRLDEIAAELKSLSADEFAGSMQNLAGGWKGENATLYLNKGQKLQDSMTSTAADLSGAASNIRTIAKRTYEAEMAALKIAETRRYR